jgi:Tfp pilus assembly protein PilV
MKNFLGKIKSNIAGFSLLETVVVLMIMAVGLVSIINLTVDSLRAQTLNRNTLIAYQLAQEGLDLIRNVRDTNWARGDDWNQHISTTTGPANFKVDYSHWQPQEISNISQAKLQVSSTTGFYLHDSNSPDSPFSRMVTITAVSSSSPSSTVSVLVKWTDQGAVHQYQLETTLYNWK